MIKRERKKLLPNEGRGVLGGARFAAGRDRRQRGIVLVVVLLCMALAGSLIVLISASLGQHAAIARQERIELTMRQLIDSGRAWAEAQPRSALEAPGITLDAGAWAPPDAEATVAVAVENEEGGLQTLLVTATLARRGYAPVRRTGRFIIR